MAATAVNHAEPTAEPASSAASATAVCAQNGAGEPPLDVVDIFVDGSSEVSLREGALRVLQHVRPCWDLTSVRFKTFTDGITNQLVGCWQGGEELGEGALLMRIYGQKTELFIDRSAEVLNMRLLHAHGLAAPLHCAFRNGLCYGFNPGRVGDTQLVRDPHISRFVSCIPSRAELELEVSLLEEHLSGLGSPVVFCHNDLLVKNIIYQEKQDRVIFIDFEYADNNYQALDIGNHFCEFGGVEHFDSSLYPDRKFQLNWLQHYLDEWHRLAGRGESASTHDVEVLYVQVNKFALASCMLWCLWALIQSAHSTIKFDFLQFAMERLDMYKRHKAEFLDMTLPPS
ncbi:ethanolamine kinase 1 isoform X2 [Dermacentor variabilis]|uniref:ethanolamine kinase 1 isoform X2 n=1 Tax=Dermacentor variabilis TaxID=34621 RepID=UPI003F5C3F25